MPPRSIVSQPSSVDSHLIRKAQILIEGDACFATDVYQDEIELLKLSTTGNVALFTKPSSPASFTTIEIHHYDTIEKVILPLNAPMNCAIPDAPEECPTPSPSASYASDHRCPSYRNTAQSKMLAAQTKAASNSRDGDSVSEVSIVRGGKAGKKPSSSLGRKESSFKQKQVKKEKKKDGFRKSLVKMVSCRKQASKNNSIC